MGSSRWFNFKSCDIRSSLQTRLGCGLPRACFGGSFLSELPAWVQLTCPSMPSLPPSLSQTTFSPNPLTEGQLCSQTTCPKGCWVPGCSTRSPLGTPCVGFLQQSCTQSLLWSLPGASGSLPRCGLLFACLFSSTILLRFLTFKPICQLLHSVLTGSCWLNPWAQRQSKHLLGTTACFQWKKSRGTEIQEGYLTRHYWS